MNLSGRSWLWGNRPPLATRRRWFPRTPTVCSAALFSCFAIFPAVLNAEESPQRARGLPEGNAPSTPQGAEVELVRAAFNAQGAFVSTHAFAALRGHPIPIPLGTSFLDPGRPECATLVLLGPPSAEYLLRIHDVPLRIEQLPRTSRRGALTLERCGKAKAELAELEFVLRSGERAILDWLLALSPAPLPDILTLLPERTSGVETTPVNVGPRPELGPLENRAAAARVALDAAGFPKIDPSVVTADALGRAQLSLLFQPGCHELWALTGGPGVSSDLDMRWLDSKGQERASDVGEVADARLAACVGETREERIEAQGAPPHEPIILFHAQRPLLDVIPLTWGTSLRAKLSEALLRHGLGATRLRPLGAWLGIQGTTRVDLIAHPEQCYAVVVAELAGEEQPMSLGAEIGGVLRQTRASAQVPSTALTICAPVRPGPGHTRLRAEVHTKGTAPSAWLLTVFAIEGATP